MESSTPLSLPRGFVDTTATDGRRLRIYYIRKTPVLPPVEDISNDAAIAAAIIRAKLLRAAEIEALRDFAAAYMCVAGESTESQHTSNYIYTLGTTAYNSRFGQ
ncbi:hypothetical protein E4U37_000281 [Claviceps purpurea]|nr:hypothetical protein E4U37_000281 [Claviceps purpurea]